MRGEEAERMGAKSDPRTEARWALDRLQAMGINAKLMQGDRCVLASMRLQADPFESLDGGHRIERLIFATVGRDRIKCLRPRALFSLPLIRILDCRDSTSIEARIRLAWRKHTSELGEARDWLRGIGGDAEVVEEGSVLALPLEGERNRLGATLLDKHALILPSAGPLEGVALDRIEDRCMKLDRSLPASIDLEIAVATRLEELRRLNRRIADDRRRRSLDATQELLDPAERNRRIRLMLVGPKLARQTKCIESLRLRGYTVDIAQTEPEGLAIFDRHSPELVMADMNLGRNAGTDFVVALRHVTGIEEVPVLLIDDARRESSREAARRAGAAGYLVYPIDVQRISERLALMVNEPRRRRFTRYNRKLPVEIDGSPMPSMTTSLGRGGMFVATDESLPQHTLQRCRLSLPELGASVACQAEVLYRRGSVGRTRGGVGVRFHAFDGTDENTLIDYLRTIDHSRQDARLG